MPSSSRRFCLSKLVKLNCVGLPVLARVNSLREESQKLLVAFRDFLLLMIELPIVWIFFTMFEWKSCAWP